MFLCAYARAFTHTHTHTHTHNLMLPEHVCVLLWSCLSMCLQTLKHAIQPPNVCLGNSSYLQDSSSPWNLPCTTLPPKLALTLFPLYFLSISELSVGIGELSWGFMGRRLPASQRSSYCFSFPGMVAEEPGLSFLWKSTVSPGGQPLPRASPDSVEVSGKWFGERVGRIYICIFN